MHPTTQNTIRNMRDERLYRDSLPKPIAMAVDFVSSMCARQPPSDVLRLLRKYEEKLKEAERESRNGEGFTSRRDKGASTNGGVEDTQRFQAEQRAQQAIDEAFRAAQEAARLLEVAIREGEFRERYDEQRRVEEQRRRDDEEQRHFEERIICERALLVEAAINAVVATEIAMQAMLHSQNSLAELRVSFRTEPDAAPAWSNLTPSLQLERRQSG